MSVALKANFVGKLEFKGLTSLQTLTISRLTFQFTSTFSRSFSFGTPLDQAQTLYIMNSQFNILS